MKQTASGNTPRCCGCWHMQGTPYGGLGAKRCLADPRRRDVSSYFHVDPASGLPLASHLKSPRPDWCPRLAEGGR